MAEPFRVMLVEDDPDIRAIAQLCLTAVGGCTVEACVDGPDALTKVEGFQPDLVLLDVMMPGMDGPTTLLELRKRPSLTRIPVVFMTAKVQPQEVRGYLELGAADVVPKPFDPMTLAATLRGIWERSRG